MMMNFDGFTEEETDRMEAMGDKAFDLGYHLTHKDEDQNEVRNWILAQIAGSLQMITYYLSVLAGEKEDE